MKYMLFVCLFVASTVFHRSGLTFPPRVSWYIVPALSPRVCFPRQLKAAAAVLLSSYFLIHLGKGCCGIPENFPRMTEALAVVRLQSLLRPRYRAVAAAA
jgi:hypothetical protein